MSAIVTKSLRARASVNFVKLLTVSRNGKDCCRVARKFLNPVSINDQNMSLNLPNAVDGLLAACVALTITTKIRQIFKNFILYLLSTTQVYYGLPARCIYC